MPTINAKDQRRIVKETPEKKVLELLPAEPNEAPDVRAPKPTDDEIGDQLISEWNGQYAFLYGAWHVYAGGVWHPKRRVELEFWRILKQNKARGIRPNAGKASSVAKYCELCLMVDENARQTTNCINLMNGLYDLETSQLGDHRPELYLTSQLPFNFEPDATCPHWEKFLQSVLVDDHGAPDWQLIRLVREAFFYSLTADTSYRVSFWLVGASGTGKSTLVNTLIALAGDSHAGIDLDTLQQNPYQIAEIAGKRLVTFSEPDSRQPLADGVYKKLVSKDPITARAPYGKPFSFVPCCKVWGSMNDTPRVSDRSDAVFGRVIIIPMNRVVPENEKDYNLDEKLKAELPGIFNWALAGGKSLREVGKFTYSKQSENAREQYRLENDAERLFLADAIQWTGDPSHRIAQKELYGAYVNWCRETNHTPKSPERVGKDWKRLSLVQGKSSDGKYTYFKGIQFKK